MSRVVAFFCLLTTTLSIGAFGDAKYEYLDSDSTELAKVLEPMNDKNHYSCLVEVTLLREIKLMPKEKFLFARPNGEITEVSKTATIGELSLPACLLSFRNSKDESIPAARAGLKVYSESAILNLKWTSDISGNSWVDKKMGSTRTIVSLSGDDFAVRCVTPNDGPTVTLGNLKQVLAKTATVKLSCPAR